MKKTINDIEVDIHNHTILSGHAYATFNEMIKEGKRKGLKVMGITDHGPYDYEEEKINQFKNMKVLPRNYDGMDILCGCEINIIDKNGEPRLAYPEDIINRLDVRVVGCHDRSFREVKDLMNAYFEVMETGYVDIIAHPFKNKGKFDADSLTKKAKEYNVILELNNSLLLYNNYYESSNQMKDLLEASKKYEWPIILSSDAHYIDSVMDYSKLMEIIEEVDFPDDLIVNYNKEWFMDIIKFNHDRSMDHELSGYVFKDKSVGGGCDIVALKLEENMNIYNALQDKVPYSFRLSEDGYRDLSNIFIQYFDISLNKTHGKYYNHSEFNHYGDTLYTRGSIFMIIKDIEKSNDKEHKKVVIAMKRLLEHNPDCDLILVSGP